MTRQAPDRRKDFADALQRFIGDFASLLEVSEISEVLQEVSETLCREEAAPSVEVEPEGGSWLLTIRYGCSLLLEREISSFLDLRGVCLALESKQRPPLMADTRILVVGVGVEDAVELRGRVVQHTRSGIALEIDRVNEHVRHRLAGLPYRMVRAHGHTSTTLNGYPPLPADELPSTVAPGGGPDRKSEESELLALTMKSTRRWQLEQTALDDVLRDVAVHEAGYGVVQIESAARTVQLVCHDGHLVDIVARPHDQGTELAVLLQKAGHVDASQLKRARACARQNGTSLGEALVELQAISYGQLLVSLRARVVFLLEKLWGAERGLARYYPLSGPPQRYLTPPVALGPRLFGRALARYLDQPREKVQVESQRFAQCRVRVKACPPFELGSLELDGAQERFLRVELAAAHSLQELTRLAGARQSQLLALLLALDDIAMLERVETTGDEHRLSQSIEKIELIHSRIHEDHFAVLGLHWSTHAQEIRTAFQDIMRHLTPTTGLPVAIQQKQTEARERVQEAYNAILSPARRGEYRKTVVDEYALENAVNMLRSRAETAKLRQDPEAACDALRRILELVPDDANARQDLKAVRPIKLRAILTRK